MKYYIDVLGNFERFVTRGEYFDLDAAVHGYASEQYAAVSIATASSRLRAIRALSRFMEASGFIQRAPKISCRASFGLPKSVSAKAISRLLAALDDETRLFCSILLDTGLRPRTLLLVTSGDYDPAARTIQVRTKGNRVGTVAIGRKVAGMLKDRTGAFFRATLQTYRKRIRKACERAGIPRITPAQLRHTAARHWFKKGASVPEVQAALLHSTPAMALHYGRMWASDGVEMQKKLSWMDGK